MEPLEIERTRRFNRFYTDLAGVLDRSILQSEFALSEARILFEIGHHPGGYSRDFVAKLGVDAGYFSRVVKRFKSKGLVATKRSIEDARLVSLFLTGKGKKTLEMLENRADSEVERCFGGLSGEERRDILSSMASILSHKKGVAPDDLVIRPYQTGELGIISYRHCVLYREEYGFDQTFESYLLEGMSRFLWDCGGKGQVWVVDYWGRIMGAIAIVETGEAEAQLRWFYLEPSCRGIGIGRKLMETAMSYCERRGIEKVFLWTVKDLEAARRLYEKFGFSLVGTNAHFLWGRHIVEEKWEFQMAGVKGPC